jgi:hypothetical protein
MTAEALYHTLQAVFLDAVQRDEPQDQVLLSAGHVLWNEIVGPRWQMWANGDPAAAFAVGLALGRAAHAATDPEVYDGEERRN